MLFQKQSTKGAFKHRRPKIIKHVKKEKNLQWSAKPERPLGVCADVNKNDTPPQTLPRKHKEC